MRIVKKINNNVALAKDEHGTDVVVFGKGVGFPSMPYELEDTSTIQTMFHHVDDEVLAAIASISSEVMEVAVVIANIAAGTLGCRLNRNLFLTLADHIQFAVERVRDGYTITNPLSDTVRAMYAAEYELGERGVALVADRVGVALPECEACSIAMHIVTAEASDEAADNMSDIQKMLATVSHITDVVERRLDLQVDRVSYDYNRFATHVRYLVKRLATMEAAPLQGSGTLYRRVANDFPALRACTDEICDYLEERYGRHCGDEERLYLMMYINRFVSGR